jgi:hypothetical protein
MENDMADTIEGDFGVPVWTIDPDGAKQEFSANDPEKKLAAMFRYSKLDVNPETGSVVTVVNPFLVFRKSSLNRIPQDGEVWVANVLLPPKFTQTMTFDMTVYPASGENDMGTIKMHLIETEQN